MSDLTQLPLSKYNQLSCPMIVSDAGPAELRPWQDKPTWTFLNGGTIRTISYGSRHSPACCRRNSDKGPSRKRKKERIKKIEDKFEYLSAIGRLLGL